MASKNLDNYFDDIISKLKLKSQSTESEITITTINTWKDLDFEKQLNNILIDRLSVSKLQLEDLYLNEEFGIYIMEMYDRKTKKLIKRETFKSSHNYYYLQKDYEDFFVPKKNLIYLYYYDSNTQTIKKILGSEESRETDTTQFFLEKKEGNEIIENNEENSFSDIKFNLIKKKNN